MKKTELTKKVVNADLKKKRKGYNVILITSLVLTTIGVSGIIENLDNKYTITMLFPGLIALFGLFSLIYILIKMIVSTRYSIGEGTIEKIFYDQSTDIYKYTIKGLKGVVTSSSNFSVGKSVYIAYRKNKAIMCYDKNKYCI